MSRSLRCLLLLVLISLLIVPLCLATTARSTEEAAAKSDKDKKGLPLESDRTWTLETEEGSWMSLDVSPDGNRIVFDLLGDLFTLPLTGGEAQPLTEGMPFDAQPRFSPDGSKVLFISDRDGGQNLWTIDLESKKTRQLTQGKNSVYQSPAWTPDGKYIVFSKGAGRFGVTKLWMLHTEGGQGIQLIKEPDTLRTVGAAVTPDGRYIWYGRRTGTWQYNGILPQYQLAYYDRETGKNYTRTARYGSAFRPTISPDGRWLVYGSRHETHTGLRIRELSSGEERWLAYPVQRDDQESVASRDVLPGMAFTPDSQSLVASYGGKIWRIPIDEGKATAVPFQAKVGLALGPKLEFQFRIEDSPTFTIRQIRDGVPSPDGRKLAFTALNRLYVIDSPGGQPRRLTSAEMTEAQPTWSPDGRWLAYVTWSDEGGHLYRVAATGGQPQRISRAAAIYQQPAWSHSGDRIVAVRGPVRSYREATGPRATGASDDLIWIPANGGDANRIAPADGRNRPHFTANPDRIYLFHGSRGLVSIRWDGTDEKEHLKVTGNKRPGAERPNTPDTILMAPVGDQALTVVNQDIYVVTVPRIGGGAPTVSVADPDKAVVPVKKLTDIGGQFPAWSRDGRKVHWSIGNAHFIYDLDTARQVEEEIATRKESNPSSESDSEESEEKEDEEKYHPAETRVLMQADRDIPQGVAVLQNARIVTMDGDLVIERGDILVRNNRITGVGRRGSLDVPSGAREFDLSGHTIVPGFVDTHAHMRPAWGIHKDESWTYQANLAYGVTTTRDPQTSTTDVITYGDLVAAGRILGPRLYSTGPGVFGDYTEDPIRDLDHARDVLKRYSEYYDTKTIKMYMAGNREQRQWIIQAAHEQKLLPTTEGGLDLQYNLTMMMDGYPGQEHSFPIFPLYQDVVKLAVETNIAYTPTLLVSYGGIFGENFFFTRQNPHGDEKLQRFTPHSVLDAVTRRRGMGTDAGPAGWALEEEYVFSKHAEVAKRIVEEGGRVGVGSHGQLQGLGYHWELWAVQSGGMRNLDALRTATLLGADAIGLSQDLGSIQSGKLADLVILERNPLEDIQNTNSVRYVMKNGRLYEGNSLDEVWPTPRKAKLPEQDEPTNMKAGLQ